ncbi:MAG: glycosyltransferase family 4 protein [Patescibacteria group bacterium]|jgi:glycosyltransferase involved in cell wall biosynthesis
MRICFFNLNRLDYEGGAEKYFVETAAALKRDGQDVFFVCDNYFYVRIRPKIENFIFRLIGAPLHQNGITSRQLEEDLKIFDSYKMPLLFQLPFSAARRKIKKLLAQADVIYCKNEFIDSWYLKRLIGKKGFAKVVLGLHTAIFLANAESFHSRVHNFLYFSRVYQKVLQLCGAVHVINNSYKDKLVESFKLDPGKIVFVPNGIKENDLERTTAGESDAFKILFAGRFTEQKGIDYLSEIIDNLSKDPIFSRIEILIAGAGQRQDIVDKLINKFSNVKYLGFVKEMSNLYRQVDICIVPSRWEMFPYNCLEPQAKSLPVVAFDIPGTKDIVVNGTTGLLTPLGEANSFSGAIKKMFDLKANNRVEWQVMKDAAYKNVSERFTLTAVAKELEKLFEKVKK